MKLSIHTTLARNSEIISSKIDDELDSIGSIIWELLEESNSLKEILPQLISEFEVSEEQCQKDCMTFILDMLDKKVLIAA